MRQLPLRLKVPLPRGLAGFYVGENAPLLHALADLTSHPRAALHSILGPSGSGKTALLAALVEESTELAALIDASTLRELGPDAIAATKTIGLLALDELDQLSGDPRCENALFGLLNARHDAQQITVMAMRVEPIFALADLRSRQQASVHWNLSPLHADDAFLAFIERAQALGIVCTPAVCDFLKPRVERNLKSLFKLLAKIDQHTLSAKRALSVPMLKELLLQER